DVSLRLPAERLDRRRPSVAGCRSENCRSLAALAQNTIHGPAKPLHSEILERQRGPVEKLEREQVDVDLNERRGRGMTEASICLRGHRLEFRIAELASNEGGH